MDAHLTANEEARSPHHDLKLGEWQLWCRYCNFRVEKNAAANNRCPNGCSGYLLIAKHVPCTTQRSPA